MSTNERMTGYDGRTYGIGDRVEIHHHSLSRYAGRRCTVVGSSFTPSDRVHVEIDGTPGHRFSGSEDTFRLVE